jgi:hypothetical protein
MFREFNTDAYIKKDHHLPCGLSKSKKSYECATSRKEELLRISQVYLDLNLHRSVGGPCAPPASCLLKEKLILLCEKKVYGFHYEQYLRFPQLFYEISLFYTFRNNKIKTHTPPIIIIITIYLRSIHYTVVHT